MFSSNQSGSPKTGQAAESRGKFLNRGGYWLISLPLAGVLLYFALRGVDWHRVWQITSSANLLLVVSTCLVASFSYFVRAVRWRILLSAEQPIGLGVVFWSNSGGYLANNFLPARTGEVLRSAMISARSCLSKTYVLTTAISERMIDGLALLTISSVVLLTIERKPAWLAVAARPFAVIGIGGAVAILLLPRCKSLIERVIERLPLPGRWRSRFTGMTEQVVRGVRSFHSVSRLAGFVALTAAIWFLDAAAGVVLARALGLHLSFGVAYLMLTGIGLGSALPSTPGNVGVYQFVTVSVLVPFGFSHTDALAYALVSQALNYVVVAFWGLVALWRYNRG